MKLIFSNSILFPNHLAKQLDLQNEHWDLAEKLDLRKRFKRNKQFHRLHYESTSIINWNDNYKQVYIDIRIRLYWAMWFEIIYQNCSECWDWHLTENRVECEAFVRDWNENPKQQISNCRWWWWFKISNGVVQYYSIWYDIFIFMTIT